MDTFDLRALRRKIRTNDRFEQSDAARDIFQEWYRIAKIYAKSVDLKSVESVMAFVTESTLKTLLLANEDGNLDLKAVSSVDSFVMSTVADEASTLIRILRTKKKFAPLALASLGNWIARRALPFAIQTVISSHVTMDTRVAFTKLVLEIVWLGNEIVREYGDGARFLLVANPQIESVVLATTNLSSTTRHSAAIGGASRLQTELLRIIRSVALRATSAEADCDPNDRIDVALVGPVQTDSRVRALLARTAADSVTIRSLWAIGALRCDADIRVLAQRAKRDASVARAVVCALHEAIVDMQSGGGSRDSDHAETFNCVSGAICDLAIACDAKLSQDDERNEAPKRSESLLRLVEAVLDLAQSTSAVNVDRFVDLLLRPPGVDGDELDLDSLKVLTRMAPSLDQNTWKTRLLPFVTASLGKCDSGNVEDGRDDADKNDDADLSSKRRTRSFDSSGLAARFSEQEQEIVNLLREGVRCMYAGLSRRRSPSIDVGKQFFEAILRAMRRGYSETERFPELAARVLASHYEDGASGNADALSWLDAQLLAGTKDASVASSASRSIFAVCKEIMMLSDYDTSSSSSLSSMSSSSSSKQAKLASAALKRVARLRGGGLANALWTDHIAGHPASISRHPEALVILVRKFASSTGEKDELKKGGQHSIVAEPSRSRAYLESAARLLDALASSDVLPGDASTALLRSVLAHSEAVDTFIRNCCECGTASAETTLRVSSETYVNALRRIDRARDDTEVATLVRSLCRHPSSKIRREIARLMPFEAIRDPSVVVRVSAIRALARRLPLLDRITIDVAEDVVLCCRPSQDDERRHRHDVDDDTTIDTSGDTHVHDLDLLKAAAPVLARIVASHPTLLGVVVELLSRAAGVSADNDAEDRCDRNIVDALDSIVTKGCDAHALETFVAEAYGSTTLAGVERLSHAWKAYVESCLSRGVVRRVVDGASNRVKEATSRGGRWIRRLLGDRAKRKESMKGHDDGVIKRAVFVEPVSVTNVSAILDSAAPEVSVPTARVVACSDGAASSSVLRVAESDTPAEAHEEALSSEIRRWKSPPSPPTPAIRGNRSA